MSWEHWKPHGLITSIPLEVQYQQAHIDNLSEINNPKETATVILIENIFNKVLFRDMDDIFVNSQQPPGVSSNKACDIVINYVESGTYRLRVLCFTECKRTNKTSPYSLKVVEKQALKYCKEYVQSSDNISFVFACTAIGAHVRLWLYREGEQKMMGFWGNESGSARWEEYKDVGIDSDGEDIRPVFEKMLSTGPQLRQGQNFAAYGSSFADSSSGTNMEDDEDEDEDEDDVEEDDDETAGSSEHNLQDNTKDIISMILMGSNNGVSLMPLQ